MENKQTAVEWLIDQVEDFIGLIPIDIIEQAKEMEMKQIMDANIKGHTESLFGRLCDSEKYYNETFKSEHNEE